MKRGFVDIPGGQVHYRTEGTGDPLFILHAAHSSSADFSRLIPLLAGSHRVIAMDHLGHGDSDPVPRQYEMWEYAQDALHVMNALGVESANVMGFATGANITIELAVIAPDRIKSVILYNCPYFPDENSRTTFLNDRPEVQMERDGKHLLDKWRAWEQALNGAAMEDVQRHVIVRLQDQLSPKRGEEPHVAVCNYDVRPRIADVKCPLMVLKASSGGMGIFHQYGEAAIKATPRGRLATLAAGAQIHLTPEEFARPILAFLADPGI